MPAVGSYMNYVTNTTATTGYATTAYIAPPLTFASAPMLAPPQRTALQWLDDEIEKTCALARA